MDTKTLPYSTTTLLLCIAVAGFALRLIFFSGYVSGDDAAYIARAFSYSEGDFSLPYSHWGTRILVVLTTALSFFLFGVNEVATVIFPLFLSMGSILVAFHLGKELFDTNTGLLAAAFTAFFPMEVLFASQLFPYTFLSFFTGLSLLLFIKGRNQDSPKLLLLAGAAMGFAYLSRVTALYCGLFFLLLILWNRKIDRSYFIFAGGFLLVFLLEMLWSAWQSGNPFFRFTEVLLGKVSSSPVSLDEAVQTAAKPEWTRPLKWYFEPFVRPIFEQEFGGFFLFLWPILIYQLIWGKSRQVKLLLLWIIPLFLYVSYGSTSPVEYKTLRRLPRYLSIIIIPCMVLVAYQIAVLPQYKLKALAVLSLAGMSMLCLLLDNSPYVTEREQKLAEYINSHPEQNFIVPRSLYFDYLYYSDFKQPPNVKHFYRDNDRSDTLKRIKVAQPNSMRAQAANLRCGGYRVVDDQNYFDNELTAETQSAIEHSIDRRDRFYHRLIKNPAVFSLISLVRDDKRLKLLTASKADSYYVYSPNPDCVGSPPNTQY